MIARPPPSEMVERVARAIYPHVAWAYRYAPDSGYDGLNEHAKETLAGLARAAIEAMRGDAVPVFDDIVNMDKQWKESALAAGSADMLNAGEAAAWCNGGRPFGYNGVLNVWRAMIDAALGKGERT